MENRIVRRLRELEEQIPAKCAQCYGRKYPFTDCPPADCDRMNHLMAQMIRLEEALQADHRFYGHP